MSSSIERYHLVPVYGVLFTKRVRVSFAQPRSAILGTSGLEDYDSVTDEFVGVSSAYMRMFSNLMSRWIKLLLCTCPMPSRNWNESARISASGGGLFTL